MMNFNGKTALITGGSSGIGLALARNLALQGAHVWLAARHLDRLEAAISVISALRVNSAQQFGIFAVDVSNASQVNDMVAELAGKAGVPDLVINSAGAVHPGYLQELELDVFRSMMDINYFGTVNITKAVLPAMIARHSGSIVNISSIAGFISIFGYSAYSASKFAVRGFTDALRFEMKPLGVKVHLVFPPDTDTPQLAYEASLKPYELKALEGDIHPLSAETVAAAILDGVSHGQYVIIPGMEGKLWYWLSSLAGLATYPILDLIMSISLKSKRSKSGSNPSVTK